MVTKPFERELAATRGTASKTDLSRPGLFTTRFGRSQQIIRPAVESMLLGIRLRGWLTDGEKELLDGLVPDRSITFLILDDRYLHPEGVELFPHNLIETAVQKGGQAVFTHRYLPNSHDISECYTIYTAVINPSQPKPLVLGFFGPDYQLGSNETENWFYRLVSLFRETYRCHKNFTQALAQRLETKIPTIIVNRCSGRVVMLNKAAAKLFGKTPRIVIDHEFGQVKDRLLSILPGRKLTMTNVNDDDLYLTVITLSATQVSEEHNGSVIVDSFRQTIRHKVAGITKAANNLEKLSHKVQNDELTAVSRRVMEAVGELELCMAQLDLQRTDHPIMTTNNEDKRGEYK